MKKNKHARFVKRQELLTRLLTAKYNSGNTVYPSFCKRHHQRFSGKAKFSTYLHRWNNRELERYFADIGEAKEQLLRNRVNEVKELLKVDPALGRDFGARG
jgi:hypothetical protein